MYKRQGEAGASFDTLKQKVVELNEEAELLEFRKLNQNKAQVYEVNRAINFLRDNLEGTQEDLRKLAQQRILGGNALKSLAAMEEGFRKFRDGMKSATSEYRQFIQFIDDSSEALVQLLSAQVAGADTMAIADLFEKGSKELGVLKALLHDVNLSEIKVQDAINKLQARKNQLLKIEYDRERNLLKLKRESLLIQKIVSPFQREEAALRNEIAQAQGTLLANEQKIAMERAAGIIQTEDQLAKAYALLEVDHARVEVLEQQLAQLTELGPALEKAITEAFESGLQGQLARLIKGEESSVKDAMRLLLKGILEAMADEIARLLAQTIGPPVMRLIFPNYESEAEATARRHAEMKASLEAQMLAQDRNTKALEALSDAAPAADPNLLSKIDTTNTGINHVTKVITDSVAKPGFKVLEDGRPVKVTVVAAVDPTGGTTTGGQTPYHAANAIIGQGQDNSSSGPLFIEKALDPGSVDIEFVKQMGKTIVDQKKMY